MNAPKYKINNDGMTLIELLATITILSIVLITFMSFFTQSMKLSVKVEDKLTSVNVAEKVLNDLRSNHPQYDQIITDLEVTSDKDNTDVKTHYVVIDTNTSVKEKALDLIRVHIKVFADENYDINNPDSELYSYIRK